MLADCLAKDKAEPTDLLRACIRHGVCQLADEVAVLARAATERQHRKALTTSTRSATTTRSGQVPREDVHQRLAREGGRRTFDVDLSRQHGQHPDPLVSSRGGRVEGIPSNGVTPLVMTTKVPFVSFEDSGESSYADWVGNQFEPKDSRRRPNI